MIFQRLHRILGKYFAKTLDCIILKLHSLHSYVRRKGLRHRIESVKEESMSKDDVFSA